jgi:DNA-binding MarR family transcriptional regulator
MGVEGIAALTQGQWLCAAMFAWEEASMSTATAVKIQLKGGPPAPLAPPTPDPALTEGELRALRGLMRAHASLAKRLDAELESAHGLPLSSYEVLRYLEEAPEGRMRMCDLAERAQLSRSGLTRLADRLERDGLLMRCTCEHDARGAYACISEQGLQRLKDARGTHLAVVREQFLSRFSEPELGALAEMWDRIAPCGLNSHPPGAHTPPARNGQ